MVLGKIYIFGGQNEDKLFNDLYTFDINTNKWKEIKIKSSIVPPPISSCSITSLYDKYLHIYGGIHNGKIQNQNYRFDLGTNEWRLVKIMGKKNYDLKELIPIAGFIYP
jgi:mRNA-degrading endonuclease HigB of HigAB toxin-antitoxin module